MKVITTGRVPVKMWLEDIEAGALAQAVDLANLPFAFKHVAIMPDAHQGYGMPIGGGLFRDREDHKIIGNVYENPELLKATPGGGA